MTGSACPGRVPLESNRIRWCNLAEQPLERRAEVACREPAEVACREPAQVQDREHLGHLRRPARVRRQDPRAEPLAFSGLLVDALVVHPRRADRHRARPNRHPPLPRLPVAGYYAAGVVVELVTEPRDVLANLSLERRSDHPTSTLTRQLIER